MRKIYWDLAIVIFCIFMIIKFTKVFLVALIIGAIVWFFVLDNDKKNEIKNKISNLYKQ